ncbi:MAG: epoxide hydrolase [Proteobacteria bacterium]|nr:epoxide hydrolase [Pseudomonadota bacterium]
MDVERFKADVDQAVLDDLRERLERTRFPGQLDDAQWSYGTELGYLRELVDYWINDFDWRAVEARLNSFDHYTALVDGRRQHFIHQRSPHDDAMPLVLTHGWPGSVLEFMDVIGPLTDPTAHGGKAADAFHVVCPAIPGYGFSEAPAQAGFDIRRVGACNAELMEGLGYSRYGAQGGDWGAIATSWLGLDDSEHCAGVHLNMVVAAPPEGDDMQGLSDRETEGLAAMAEFMEEGAGYQAIQGTRPQTLGYGLNDSPAGLAAWIVEKFHAWSDCDGRVENRFSKDQLLANITLYWVTGSITSSTRLYCETRRAGRFGALPEKIKVPTGCAIFPRELFRPPRRWAEAAYNVVHWSEMNSGGHFAAMEEPAALVEDMRTFFRQLR